MSGESRSIGPEGYSSAWQAMQDLLCFGPAIFEEHARFLVFLFHAVTTTMRGRETDTHSGNQAVGGIYSAKHGRWKHGGAGVSRGSFWAASKWLAERGFLRRDHQYTDHGRDAPTEYSIDWLTFHAAVEAWNEGRGPQDKRPLLDETGSVEKPPPGAQPLGPSAQPLGPCAPSTQEPNHWALPFGAESAGGPTIGPYPLEPNHWAHSQDFDLTDSQDSKSQPNPRPAVEKVADAAPVSGASTPPLPRPAIDARNGSVASPKGISDKEWKHDLFQKHRRHLRVAAVRETIEAAWGNRLSRNEAHIPQVVLSKAEKLQVPNPLLLIFLRDWTKQRREANYRILVGLFIRAVEEDLIPWCAKHPDWVRQAREQELREEAYGPVIEAEQLNLPAGVDQPERTHTDECANRTRTSRTDERSATVQQARRAGGR